MSSLYYQASGRVPASALPIVLLYACATLPAAWVYAWLTLHTPALIKLFFTMCFSLWLGYMVQQAGARAKVRNPAWMAGLGVIIGVAGWYFQWPAWVALHGRLLAPQPDDDALVQTFAHLALHPAALVGAARDIAQAGTWGLFGQRMTGVPLAMFWLAELGALLLFVRSYGRRQAGKPFCETANAWADPLEVTGKFAFVDDPARLARMLEQDPGALPALLAPWSDKGSPNHARVTIYRCPGEDAYLSISNVMLTMEKDADKRKQSVATVLDYLRLPGIDASALLHELDTAGEPAAALAEVPVPKELAPALDYLNAGRFDKALAAATPHATSDRIGTRTDANRLCGLASSRLGQWDAAAGFWRALYDDEPSARNALQVATSSVMAGDPDNGKLWVERARTQNAARRELPAATIETGFLTALTERGYLQGAMGYLDRLRQFYVDFGSTDPTLLFMQQFPRFDVFLDKSLPIVRANLKAEQERDWYLSMLPHLDERGQAQLQAWMQAQAQPA